MAQPVQSRSSQWMGELCAWRNGFEVRDLIRGAVELSYPPIAYILIAEAGFACLTLAAVVESVAYNVFILVEEIFELESRVEKLAESSGITVGWGIGNLVANVISPILLTHESLVRIFFHIFVPDLELMRYEDRGYLLGWLRENHIETNTEINAALDGLLGMGRAAANEVEEGARFLVNDIVTDEIREDFCDYDPDLYMFVLTKTVWQGVFGTRKSDSALSILKAETRLGIEQMRSESFDEQAVERVKLFFESRERYEQGPTDGAEKALFLRLQGIASGELQASLFLTECWKQAVELLVVNTAP